MRKLLLASVLVSALSLDAAVKIEKVAYRGWPNCYRISNGTVELIVTTDVGPRVIRYAFIGGRNIFKEYGEQMGRSGEKEWMPRGGHRLWMSPEDPVGSYALDNSPIHAEQKGDGIILTGNVEKETGLQKQITVTLAPTGSAVEVSHQLINKGSATKRLAAWALTMMAQGGTAITGFPPRGTHPKDLAPTNPLVMWAYTDFSDPRWKFTKKYLVLKQDPKAASPQKAGTFNKKTFGAYLLGSDLFIKQSTASDPLQQPDFGCSFETFSSADFLEMETLSALKTLPPGASIEHVEHWNLHRNITIPSWSDDALDRVLLPLLNR
jgi:hypothetical protein